MLGRHRAFYKLKVYGHPAYSKSISTAFPRAFAQLCLCVLFMLLLQSWPTLCDPMDCSLPGSSVHGILQAKILEWVAISSSRDLPNSGIEQCLLCLLYWQAGSLPLEPPVTFWQFSPIFQTFSLLLHLLWWSMISYLWYCYCNCFRALWTVPV